jgi:dTDP-glucose 4,6-dehydratase
MSATLDGLPLRDLDEAIGHCAAALEDLRGKRLFVTGGTGFFGRWLTAVLARAWPDYRISATVLTRDPLAFRARYPELATSPALTFARGDVRYFEFPKGEFSHVVHAAADTSVAADRDSMTLIDTIVGGTARVLEFATACGAQRLLMVSSGAVYGPQPPDLARMSETYTGACDPLDPRSAYGQAKRLAEQMCACAHARGGVQATIARAFAFVGPGLPLDAHFAIGNFIRDAVAGRDIVVAGDGTPLRSYLYAGDLAAWLLTLLVEGEAGCATNVGSDRAVSIAELASQVAAQASPSPEVVVRGVADANAQRSRYIPDVSRARALGLEAWTPLDEAIRRTMAHARRTSSSAPAQVARNEHARDERLTFVVDVDGVVASLTPGNDYTLAEPLSGAIEAINRLHEKGHRIVMFTARGSATGIDWRETTERQFAQWGLRYHELRFGKPAADYYIDDRLLPISALGRLAEAEA